MSEVTEARIRRIMKENIELTADVDEIKLDDVLVNYGINSITFIKFIVLLENEFDIQVDDENLDYTKMSTLNSLISYIENCLSR